MSNITGSIIQNVTGWNELFAGNPVVASYTLFNTAWFGWILGILFIIFETMLIMKTRDPVASVIMGLIFLSVYIGVVHSRVVGIMLVAITILIAGILYAVIFKK
jgi:hypothetical protein